jgi:phage anti-repressor protein
MITYILTDYKVLTTGVEGGHKYLTTKIFYGGIEMGLLIFLKDKQAENLFAKLPIIALKGNFKEELNPLTTTLYEAEQVDLPKGDNWLAFFTNYFLENRINSLKISEYNEGFSISTDLEYYHIWIDISKDKQVLKKAEFGRWLPIEKPEHKRKTTSWTKGVFVNDNDIFVQFMQNSWDGEEGVKYQANFNENNLGLVSKFLSIPFYYGWTEFDYRIGKESFYKASAKAFVEDKIFENSFPLLDIGEQDIPFGFIDEVSQWTRVKWCDSFLNNFRRKIDETKVNPIKKHS